MSTVVVFGPIAIETDETDPIKLAKEVVEEYLFYNSYTDAPDLDSLCAMVSEDVDGSLDPKCLKKAIRAMAAAGQIHLEGALSRKKRDKRRYPNARCRIWR